jgi:hypothetical protein
MKISIIIKSIVLGLCLGTGIGAVTACGDFDGTVEQTEPDYGAAEQAISTIAGVGAVSFGVNSGTGSLFTPCYVSGPVSQQCKLVKPAQSGDAGFYGTPTRYQVSVVGVNFGPLGAGPVRDAAVYAAGQLTQQLQSPQLTSPVLVDYVSGGPVPVGINISGGSVAGNGGAHSDNYIRLEWSGCSAVLQDSLPGDYKRCNQANVTLDIVKLNANFSGSTLTYNKAQLVYRAIVSALGVARQEGSPGYPSVRDLKGVAMSTMLTPWQKDQMQCIGFTASNTFGFSIDTSVSDCRQTL